jgi:hypothetical protein
MRLPTVLMTAAVLLTSGIVGQAESYKPDHARIRAGLQREARPRILERSNPAPVSTVPRQQNVAKPKRDSVWNGLLIGAAAGVAGGYLWARDLCGPNDSECLYYAGPVGVFGGAGIGAVIGAVIDALHR